MPCCNTATYKRLQRALPCQFNYTAHAIKHHTELCRGFSCDCTRSTAHDTKPTQAAIIPPAPRWSVSQRRNTSSTYQIPAPRRTLYSSAQTAYYNNVYKGAGVRHRYGSTPDSAAHRRPSKPGGVSMLSTPGISLALCFLPGTGGAEPLAALAAALFGLSPDSQ